jgi:hypothetical protein
VSTLERFEVRGSHFEVGLSIGERFAEQIQRALDSYPFFQQRILSYHQTTEG